MRETSVGSLEEVSLSAAQWMAAALRDAADTKDRVVFALPGGRSIARPLAALANELIDWQRIEIFFVDERHLPLGSVDRNDTVVDELFTSELVRHGRLREAQIHRAPHLPGHLQESARDYWDELKRFGGTVDVALFGAGEDGHIASLFPGRNELAVDVPGMLAVRGSPKPPAERITMSPGLIASVAAACVLFFGSGKRGAFDSFRDDRTPVASCPAKLAASATNLLVLADHAANGSDDH
ncbi:MAG: 6-phosphogluconolactonase [Spirochaetales bacterium]|nr:6-phosphogluconolactonase [Spirochaetales bacterium]